MRSSHACLLVAPLLTVAHSFGVEIVALQATYRTTVLYEGQTQDVGDRTVTVRAAEIDGVPAWRVVSQLTVEGTATADTVEFRRTDLRPLGRRAKFGQAELTLIVDADVARGLLVVSRQLQPLNVPLGKASFLNYYALRTAIAAWPLERSWKTDASMLELKAEPQFVPLTLAVVGEERVSVPAGAYDCWVVTVAGVSGPLEIGERYWVAKDDRIVVRTDERFGDRGAHLQLELTQLRRF
jgi:hypothetical protein